MLTKKMAFRLSLTAVIVVLVALAEVRGSVAATYTVTNTNDTGAGSLRQAIVDANNNSGTTDTITFNIPVAGVQTISPLSALPAITDPVIIDGLTQSGADCSSWPPTLLIELDGSSAGAGADGLQIQAGSSTVRGLVINRFGSDGIQLQTLGGNTIECNFVGTDATGTLNRGNASRGVLVSNVPNNTIGGATASVRNLVSGNQGHGVQIQTSSATGNLVQGNYIGTDVNGSANLGNGKSGVSISDAPNNTIGGTIAGTGNVISGNGEYGVTLTGSSTAGTLVQGNYLGTDASGSNALANSWSGVSIDGSANNNTIGGTSSGARNIISGNGYYGIRMSNTADNVVHGNHIGTGINGTESLGNVRHGVYISGNAQDNTIGGTSAGESNLIVNNGWDGIWVGSGTDNLLSGNSILANGGLGIDLGNDGVTANDPDDSDSGANNLQNYPVITKVTIHTSGQTIIEGTLDSTPATTFHLEFFHSSAQDGSGHGEGETYLGSTTANTDGNGDASFTVSFGTVVPQGNFISATATDPNDNTSEFCQNYVAPPATAVFLAAFEAYGQDGQIVVRWETVSEVDNLGFHLYRSEDRTSKQLRVTEALIHSQIPGSPWGARYEFLDRSVKPGITYYYWLEDVDIYGVATRHGPVSASLPLYRCHLPLIGR